MDEVGSGPFPLYTLIYCRSDEVGLARVAAFPGDAEATEHAGLQLLRRPRKWISVVIGRGVDAELSFLGAWDRDDEGSITWQAASMA